MWAERPWRGDRVDHRPAVAEAGGEGLGLMRAGGEAGAGCGSRGVLTRGQATKWSAWARGRRPRGSVALAWRGGLGMGALLSGLRMLRDRGRGPESATANTLKRWSKGPAWGSRGGSTRRIADAAKAASGKPLRPGGSRPRPTAASIPRRPTRSGTRRPIRRRRADQAKRVIRQGTAALESTMATVTPAPSNRGVR